MGPYCQFCDHRCFVHNPRSEPRATIIATCARGQVHDLKHLGYNYRTIQRDKAAATSLVRSGSPL